jgi:hypothetical protein
MQTTDRSAAAYVRYRALDDTNVDYESSLPIDVGQPSTVNAGGVIAYSIKRSGSVLGFAFGEMGDDLVSLRESKATYSPSYIEKENEKIFETYPSIAAALALPLTDGSSIGFQVIVTTGYKRTDKTKDYFNIITPIASLDTQKTDQSISASAGFGYLLRTQNTQAGFLLRSGTASLKRQTFEYDHQDIDTPIASRSGSDSTPAKIYYSESPQFTVGGYHRLSHFFGFAFEAAYTLSNVSNAKDRDVAVSVDHISNDTVTPFGRNYTNTTDAALLLKGGIEFNPRGGLAFTLGCGYDYRKTSSESETMNRVRIRSTLELWYAMLGAHYALSAGTDISLLISGGYVKTEARLEQESLYSLDLDSTLIILDTGIAVTTRY